MQEILLSVFFGISISFAGLGFFVYSGNKDKLYALFAVFSLFSGLYFLLIALSRMLEMDLGVGIIFSAAIYYGVFPWFLFQFVGKKQNVALWIESAVFAVAFFVYSLAPPNPGVPLWQIIAHVGLLGLMVIAISSSIHYRKKGGKNYRAFSALCWLFVFLALEEIVRTYTGLKLLRAYVRGIPPLDVYPLLFMISMGIRISNDFILRKELQVQQIQNELNEKSLKLAELEKKRLEDEVEYKKKDLLFFGMELNLKNQFVTSIVDRLNDLKNAKKSIQSTDLEELIQFAKNQVRIDQNLEYFHTNIDKVNHEFISRLKADYPELTENELHLASLLRIKLNTKEIASIKNITPDSVKVMRYRLRKKFHLDRGDNLIEFLHGF
jgi:DNA-binding CsgD family transcriptional regulator